VSAKRKNVFVILLIALFAIVFLPTASAQPLPPAEVRLKTTAAGVELNWIDGGNDGATTLIRYEIMRRVTRGSNVGGTTLTGTTATTYTDTGATPGTQYYYVVRDVNSGGSSGWSEEIVRFCPFAAPTAEARNYKTESIVRARWPIYENEIVKTFVGLATVPGEADIVDFIDVGHATEHTFSGLNLETGKEYFVTVKVQNSTGNLSGYGTSICSSRGFIFDFDRNLVDNASSTFFNNAMVQVMTQANANSVNTLTFGNDAIRRYRAPITLTERGIESRFNAPVEVAIGGTGFPATLAAAQQQLRIADEWGNEVPSNVTAYGPVLIEEQFLFENGTENVSFESGYTSGTGTGEASENYLGNNYTRIRAITTNGTERSWRTSGPVDLTGWDEIAIDWENTGANDNDNRSRCVVSTAWNANYTTTVDAGTPIQQQSFARRTDIINVSALGAGYYIRVHARRNNNGGDSYVNVYSISLRKYANRATATIIANLPKGGTRNYWAFWGGGNAAYPAFITNSNETSQRAWSRFYSRKLLPAGPENWPINSFTLLPAPANTDDGAIYVNLPWSFPFFNQSLNAVYFGTNGYVTRDSYTTWTNVFNTFRGTNAPNGMLAVLWCDTMAYRSGGTPVQPVPQNSGMYSKHQGSGDPDERFLFYFRGNRYTRTDDIYIHQTVAYRYGDIALRYEYLSPGALWDDGLTTDNGVNDRENTAGISNNDNSNYFWTTPLIAGIGKTPTSFFQYKNAVSSSLGATEDAVSVAGAGFGWAGRFESHIFDSRMATPEWQNIITNVTAGGGRIYIFVRTGSTPEPDSSWSSWSLAVSNAIGGPQTTALSVAKQRFIQYRCEFFKDATADAPVLNRVEFKCRGLEITKVTDAPIQVSQGQDNIPIKVAVKNYDSVSASLTDLTPTFSLGNYTLSGPSPSLPDTINAGVEKEYIFNVNVADNSLTGTATIDANATATIGTQFSDLDADVKDYWEVLRKAELSIAQIDALPLTVTKGQTVTVWMTIDNTGGTPFEIATASLNIKPGSYTVTLDPSVIGTIVAPGMSFPAKFTVKIELDSDSGVATLNGAATGTNVLSLKETGTGTAIIQDTWTVQNPPELVIQSVVASDTVYRGQTGIPVFLNIINVGEALAYWNSSKLWFSWGSYDDPPEAKNSFPIDVYGGLSSIAEYWVNVREDSATGTSDVDASIIFTDSNSGDVYDDPLFRALFPASWLIIGEKIKVYKDSAMLFESASFNLPAAGLDVDVYARAFDLAYYREYVVRWYRPDGSEYAVTTPPKTSDDIGAVSHQISIDSTPSNMGSWRVKVTNPLNTHTACENVFQIVSPASPAIHISLPAKVSVGQTFNASATIINSGGAVLKNAYPGVLLTGGTGAASLVVIPDSTDKRNIEGNGAATFSYQLHADTAGAGFTLRGAGYGLDGNSDEFLTAATYTSNPCIIQTPPLLTVDSVTEAYTNVYRNQQNMTVTMRVRNGGQADAVVEAASLSFNAGLHYQVINPPTAFPFTLAGSGGIADIVFTVSIDENSPTGVVTASCSFRAHDANNPSAVYGVIDKVFGWTISAVAGICSANSTFNPQQYSFNVGQTVNARFMNLPLNTAFRIRFYNDSPTGGTLVKTSPPLNSGAYGVCDDQWFLDAATVCRRWRVVIDNGNAATPGTQFGFQYFDVQNPGNLQAGLTLSPSDHVFIGDTITATLVVDNTQTAGSTIGSVTPALLQKTAAATGNAEKLSGPLPDIASVAPLMPGVYTWSYEASEDTTTDTLKKFALTATLPQSASGFDLNTGAVVNSNLATSNGIYIYRRGLEIGSITIDFATALPGGNATPLNFKVMNSGNYPLNNIKWFTADMRNQWTDYISKANLSFSPANFAIPVSGEVVVAGNLSIDHNQASGSYIATMTVYEDLNNNSYYDSAAEPGKLFSVKVEIPRTKSIVVDNPFVDLDNWAPGQTAITKKLYYFNGGNLDLENIKVVQTPPAGSATFIVAAPANPGRLGVASPTVSLDVSANVPALQTPGIYIATFTIFDDEGPLGLDGADPQKTFAVKIGVGTKNFSISPALLDAGIATPAHVLENLPALQFQINNTGGLGLTSLKSLPGNLKYLANSIATENNIAIFLPANVGSGASGNGSMSLYIPMGTPAGNFYLGKMWVYEDGNGNSIWDNGEASASFEVKATVPTYSAVQVIPSTVDLGDVAANTGISTTFLCRNIGNTTLSSLLWERVPLLSPTDSIPDTSYSFSGLGVSVAPGATFTREISITVPAGTDDGSYLGNMAWLFEDLDANSNRTVVQPADPQSGFKVACRVGNLSLLVEEPVGGINSTGDPNSLSLAGNFSIKNDGSLTLARPRATATALIYSLDPLKSIPAGASSFSPSSIGYIVTNTSQPVSWRVQVPPGVDAGEYNGTLTVWNDTFNYGVIDPGEAFDTAPLKLVVNSKRVIEVWPDPVQMPSTPKNTTVTKTFEIRNRGNIPLDHLAGIPVNIRTPGGDIIPSAFISFTIPAATVVPNGSVLATATVAVGEVNPGNYVSSSTLPMRIYEDHNNPGFGFDSGIEAYDFFELRLTVGEKKFSIGSPVSFAAAALPGQTVLSNAGTITNNSSDINLSRLKWRAGNLVSGTDVIASESVSFLPPPLAVTKGGSLPFSVQVNVLPWIPSGYVPPGTYIGTHTVWEDDYVDGVQDLAKEASATFQTVLVVSPVSKLAIVTDPVNLGDVPQGGDSGKVAVTVTNTGNVTLTTFVWGFTDLFKGADKIEGATMLKSDPLPASLDPTGSFTVDVWLEGIADTQPVGYYESSLANFSRLAASGFAEDTMSVNCTIISGGPPPAKITKDSIYQDVNPALFTVPLPSQTDLYFLSAWVCPGSGSADLAFIQYDAAGTPLATISATVKADGSLSVTDPHASFKAVLSGICESEPIDLTLPDSSIENSRYFRVYFAFNLVEDVPDIGADSLRIILHNSSPMAGQAVWFDGIKLERAFDGQTRPTTWHAGATLFSPRKDHSLNGDHQYYEW